MAMQAHQQQSKLASISSFARKVYECVPIKEAWPANKIAAEVMRVSGSTMERRRIDQELGAMVECDLIKEPSRGYFRRIEVKTSDKPANDAETVVGNVCADARRAAEAKLGIARATTAPVPEAENRMDKLARLASSLREAADTLDDIAIEIAQSDQMANEKLSEISQFKALARKIIGQ